MRIIAGQFRSRLLHSLRGAEIRPTSDRLRETLFNVLTAGNPSALEGSVWLDLFAGTGAVGIEALSRGAAMVYFIESSKAAADLIQKNLEPLEVAGKVRVLRQEVRRAIPALAVQMKPNFIFLDPPYAMQNAYSETLTSLDASPLAELALVIAEHEKKFDPGEKFGSLHRTRRLDQGDTALSFYHREVSSHSGNAITDADS
jgi:16S rRNA (guanine966-N2)-methyltransferase